MELRIATARGAAATALMAGVLLAGLIAAHPAQALAAQKTSVATTSAVSAKLAATASGANNVSVESGAAESKASTKVATASAAVSTKAAFAGKTAASATSGMKALTKSARDAQPRITRKQARRIALDDACYKKKQVKKLKVKPGKRSGQDAFVVTFRFKKMHYSYAVAKWGGDILSRSAHMGKAGNGLMA